MGSWVFILSGREDKGGVGHVGIFVHTEYRCGGGRVENIDESFFWENVYFFAAPFSLSSRMLLVTAAAAAVFAPPPWQRRRRRPLVCPVVAVAVAVRFLHFRLWPPPTLPFAWKR